MRTDLTDAMRTTLIVLFENEQGRQVPNLYHPSNQRLIREGLLRRDLITRGGRLTPEGRATARELMEEGR